MSAGGRAARPLCEPCSGTHCCRDRASCPSCRPYGQGSVGSVLVFRRSCGVLAQQGVASCCPKPQGCPRSPVTSGHLPSTGGHVRLLVLRRTTHQERAVDVHRAQR